MRLSYDEAGRGACVVLIHGHPFDRTLWAPQLAALPGGFRVLAPDLRGFGRSPVTPGCVLMREYAADIEELLAALDIPALIVAGTADPWSDAAVTDEILAHLRRPELVMVEGAGHLPNLEAEAEFNEALLSFLGRHAP